MKDRVKIALKRGTSGLLAVLLAVCLVGQPKAKAVVSETALLGSIFGSLLVSMGYSWAADNMDVPGFGEALYKLMQEHDESNKDTGLQLLRDLNIAALTAGRPGTIQFNYAWVQAARSFAEWFEKKFFVGDTVSASVYKDYGYLSLSDGGRFYLSDWTQVTSNSVYGTTLKRGDSYIFSDGQVIRVFDQGNNLGKIEVYDANGNLLNSAGSQSDNFIWWICSISGELQIWRTDIVSKSYNRFTLLPTFTASPVSSSLNVEKPQEVHYPEVAEDGSQVYEIAVDGVTATDIEGIIQGAVDRILAGTAAIAGSIADAQAKPGEITSPEIDPYKVGLSSVFPFCIPFDVYNMVTMFVAEPEAPHAEWTFSLPWGSQEYSVGWDLAAFDGVARVCRDMELVLFAVGLAVITYKVIKW